MPFVKLDTCILDSSLWLDRIARDLFITALLMAEPHELREPAEQIRHDSCKGTGFFVPAGWYGIVRAAGPGIIYRAGMDSLADGLAALEKLGAPDPDSRSLEHGGRRMVRIDGGWLILNFQKYREKDYSARERVRRWRFRNVATPEQAGAPASGAADETPATAPSPAYSEDFLAFWAAYPRKVGKGAAWKAWRQEKPGRDACLAAVEAARSTEQWTRERGRFIPHPATWIRQRRFEDGAGGDTPASRVSGRDLGEWAARQRAGGAPLAQPPTTANDLPAEGRP